MTMGTSRVWHWTTVLAAGALLAACALPVDPISPSPNPSPGPSSTGALQTARLLFAGDVMLGRGVASRTAADPSSALAGVRDQVRAADLAVANLESPLTTRPHSPSAGPYALE
ncbi:MAG: CapA family protein, partial [Kineosporiaceae bacterium]